MLNKLATVYADESDDKKRFVIACIAVPTLSLDDDYSLCDDWRRYYDSSKKWRKLLKSNFNIPVSKELKGSKLATGRNRYDGGIKPIYGNRAFDAYKFALNNLDFLPDTTVFSVSASSSYSLYGYKKLEASLYAVFQRLQTQASKSESLYQLFFDEGHNEYRRLYRKACVHLPTGSRHGSWETGSRSKNMPLKQTIKDANFKDSKYSHFVQIADLIAYATLLKSRSERGELSEKESRLGFGNIHDEIPRNVLNTYVSSGGTDGIKRLD